jgi:8-oxo-dGTP pyrophosphatase MutT (NUDIX family)
MIDLATVAERLSRLGKDPGESVTTNADPTSTWGPQASVAAIFRDGGPERGAELFFIVRAERDGDPWSGHVAFPGGRRDASDGSLLATAIRETREEVGFDLARAELLARLPDLPAFTKSKRGTMVVSPFVFALREDAGAPRPNVEVRTTLWVPLGSLAEERGKATFDWTWEGKDFELPCIYIGPEQHRLWGMTHRMFETLLEALDG